MIFFGTNHMLNSVMENPLKLETPLGNIVFKATINEAHFNSNSLEIVKCNVLDCYLSSLRSNNCEVECLRTKFNPVLPPDMKVDECFAFIWRIQALENLNISLQCLLETSLIGSPDSGEHLIAQSFEHNSINLSIGTEDEEKIELRAKNNDWVPHRFQTTIISDNIRYLDQGLEVHFSLLKGEKIQIQFIAAWVLKTNNDLSTWYAVEQSTIEILNQVGFY